jgi:membrane protein DedA with SNARE-associated domain
MRWLQLAGATLWVGVVGGLGHMLGAAATALVRDALHAQIAVAAAVGLTRVVVWLVVDRVLRRNLR